jgi:hypothetical protein
VASVHVGQWERARKEAQLPSPAPPSCVGVVTSTSVVTQTNQSVATFATYFHGDDPTVVHRPWPIELLGHRDNKRQCGGARQ